VNAVERRAGRRLAGREVCDTYRIRTTYCRRQSGCIVHAANACPIVCAEVSAQGRNVGGAASIGDVYFFVVSRVNKRAGVRKESTCCNAIEVAKCTVNRACEMIGGGPSGAVLDDSVRIICLMKRDNDCSVADGGDASDGVDVGAAGKEINGAARCSR
jgi:hypothetical protein